jgi:hypothetical protein
VPVRAKISVEVDPNILALKRMLVENGIWLVWVDSRRITKVVKVPRETSVDQLIEHGQGVQPDSAT